MSDQLTQSLIRDEGIRLSAYTDSLGYLTIGVGRLVDARKGGGLTKAEALFLLSNDVARVKAELAEHLPWTSNLDPARFGALANMYFNLGSGLLAFKNTLAHIQAGEYEQAAEEMLHSKWATQVGARAHRLAEQIRTGLWQ